ncbi:MAG: hypothetical protein ACYDAK_07460 [Candidatus Limnocylindrales bacterium]
MSSDPDRTRLEAALSELGTGWELLPCDPALADTAAFCAAYGFALEDAAVMARDRIVLGGGSRTWKVVAPPAILRALPNAVVVAGLAGLAGGGPERKP